MYDSKINSYVERLADLAGVSGNENPIASESLACLLGTLAGGGIAIQTPQPDFTRLSIRLSLLTQSLLRSNVEGQEWLHYTLAMGYEQTASAGDSEAAGDGPRSHDAWYRLALAVLHYLAGGYRVQAMTSMFVCRSRSGQRQDLEEANSFLSAVFDGAFSDAKRRLTVLQLRPTQRETMRSLVLLIEKRTDILLSALGEGNEAGWAEAHGLDTDGAKFWMKYLRRLRERGITSFTPEQGHFDSWLVLERELLVQIPTGAGKSIVGELLSALHLASGRGVVWLLPTRALVRQVKRQLSGAFSMLDVEVDELPATEDPIPLFSDESAKAMAVSVTTPEKLVAFLRANPTGASSVGLVVFDEAHLLLESTRGVASEECLRLLRDAVPTVRYCLMTGMPEASKPLARVMAEFAPGFRSMVNAARPSRRIYGVVTDAKVTGGAATSILIHRPDAARMVERFEVQYPAENRQQTDSGTNIAERLAKRISGSRIRSVFFLQKKNSTEAQARRLANHRKNETQHLISEGQVQRLRLELGRPSVVEETARFGAAPHHGALSSLEQHFVERWTDRGAVRTVFATPTLAQGVNLPFNLSVLTYLVRSTGSGSSEKLSQSEIMNMLGRAGRAGRASDGLCLVAVESKSGSAASALKKTRSIFFGDPPQAGISGLASLLDRMSKSYTGGDWVAQLGGIDLGEIQAVALMLLRLHDQGFRDSDSILRAFEKYPSFLSLPSRERMRMAAVALSVQSDFEEMMVGYPVVRSVVLLTGLPPEYCYFLVRNIESQVVNGSFVPDDWGRWAAGVVVSSLEECVERPWMVEMLGGRDLADVAGALDVWRNGAPRKVVESFFGSTEPWSRLSAGDFANRYVSLWAQFWSAVPVVCDLLGVGGRAVDETMVAAAALRDGVPSVDAIVWLRAIGGLDRVLASYLANDARLPDGSYSRKRSTARDLLLQWNGFPSRMPLEHRVALLDVLQEM